MGLHYARVFFYDMVQSASTAPIRFRYALFCDSMPNRLLGEFFILGFSLLKISIIHILTPNDGFSWTSAVFYSTLKKYY